MTKPLCKTHKIKNKDKDKHKEKEKRFLNKKKFSKKEKQHKKHCPIGFNINPSSGISPGDSITITLLFKNNDCTKHNICFDLARITFPGVPIPVEAKVVDCINIVVQVPENAVSGTLIVQLISTSSSFPPKEKKKKKCNEEEKIKKMKCPVLTGCLIITPVPVDCLVNPVCSQTFCDDFTTTCSNITPSGRILVVSTSCPDSPFPCVTPVPSNLCFTTIQDAVNAATMSGDLIIVCPGTYQEAISIPAGHNGITLTSQNPAQTFITPPPAPPGGFTSDLFLFDIQSTCVTIDGFMIQGPALFASCAGMFNGIFVHAGGSAVINNNVISNIRDANPLLNGCQRGNGIRVGGITTGDIGSALIVQNTINGYQKTGIVVNLVGSCSQVIENKITGTGFNINNVAAQNGIQISRGATALVRGNTTTDNIFFNPVVAVSVGILDFLAGVICAQDNISLNNQVGIYSNSSDSQFTSNNSSNNGTPLGLGSGYGIFMDTTSNNNTISLNTALNNATMDLVDNSVGNKSCNTANMWLCNKAETDNLGGCLVASTTPTSTTGTPRIIVSITVSPDA